MSPSSRLFRLGSELGASNLGFQLLQSWLSRNLHLRTSLLISIDCLLSCIPSRAFTVKLRKVVLNLLLVEHIFPDSPAVSNSWKAYNNRLYGFNLTYRKEKIRC